MQTYPSINAYLRAQSKEVQPLLREMYAVVKAAAPAATEAIKYGMPTFVGQGNIVHFAAMKGHLGFYPASSGVAHFAKELTKYSTSKGCIRIPYDTALPKALITKIVKFRVKEDREGR
jgi:uncharacterized protein YdhG (YjbR/CyaY superfamily)